MDHFRGFYASRCSLFAPPLSISRVFGGYLSTTDTHLAGNCRPSSLTFNLIVGYRRLDRRRTEGGPNPHPIPTATLDTTA